MPVTAKLSQEFYRRLGAHFTDLVVHDNATVIKKGEQFP